MEFKNLENKEELKKYYETCLEQTQKDIARIEANGSEAQKKQYLWTWKNAVENYKQILSKLN